ncbi:YcnI family protein [Amycolatopsis anabasis]|uniref:YcnI family protein n=1 Tax=Amycolatopsis anabasis TaxID=1840409 RepID=UPI00131ADE2A|nr:YcnI family protein [Amycolatopsis anabasis]
MARVVVTAGTALAVLAGGGPVASAHVTVHSDDAVRGGFAELAFRVPTEDDTAGTVELRVAIPADQPIASVSVRPHPGWTYQVSKVPPPAPVRNRHGEQVTEVVREIKWAAVSEEAAIKPGEYEDFRVWAGPLPDADRLVFKVLQTYEDGRVARWIDVPATGAPEPEHPAPVLALAGNTGVSAHAHGGAAAAGASATSWWAFAVAGLAVLVSFAAGAVSVAHRRRGDQGGGPPA